MARSSDRAAGQRRRRARSLSAAVACFTLAASSGAVAQVIEIGLDGEATTYAAPTIFTSDGAQSIVAAVAPPSTGAPGDVGQLIAEAAARHQVSADLISEVAYRESRYRQNAVSRSDAVGVMQLMAGTARDLGVDRYDVRQNIHGGAAYLRSLMDRYGGDLRLTLAAYNAGPGAVARYRGVPPFAETQAYVASILSRLSQRAPVLAAATLVPR